MRSATCIRILLFINIVLIVIMIPGGCTDNASSNQDRSTLRLTEIHYHPLELGNFPDDSLEFVEIKNIGSTTVDLYDLEFTAGIKYSFSSGETIDPNGFYVIASSKKGFKQRYGFEPDGVYSGQLKNSGETIELKDNSSGEIIFSQTYSDSGAWPKTADGDGYSLVPVNNNPDKNETGPEFWRSSYKLHGSPGKDDLLESIDSSLFDLRITEIHYHPQYSDTSIEDSLEFIELKNIGTKTIDMTGVVIDSAIEYNFETGVKLSPDSFIVLASNFNWFKKQYGFEPFDTYKGQLKNSSETIIVYARNAGVQLIAITYKDDKPWPKEADGKGRSLVPLHANPSMEEQNNPAAWRASFRLNGSPGKDDPGAILVNEVLTHTDPPQLDAIELYNPNQIDIDISGWFLSDQLDSPLKYRIPDKTIIKAGGYIVFTENDFSSSVASSPFKLSENGDDVILSADSSGCSGYCHSFSFGALERGVSYGRYIIQSTGDEVFVPLANVTLGKANSDPLVGPVVISEIMHKASNSNMDFLELTNIGNQEVFLYDQQYPENTWRIQIDTAFFPLPQNISIKTGESIIIKCGTATVESFASTYNIPEDVQILSFNINLHDHSAKIELEKPMEPDKDNTTGDISTKIEYMEYDKVSYKPEAPWPVSSDSKAISLTRISNNKFGNDPANWKRALPTPGKVEK
ncbi:MAG: lamin tail domain-containing protein [Fibrobacter sp.]|nr:lamin tail domain-containing protein [Fibrobacter sp.]